MGDFYHILVILSIASPQKKGNLSLATLAKAGLVNPPNLQQIAPKITHKCPAAMVQLAVYVVQVTQTQVFGNRLACRNSIVPASGTGGDIPQIRPLYQKELV